MVYKDHKDLSRVELIGEVNNRSLPFNKDDSDDSLVRRLEESGQQLERADHLMDNRLGASVSRIEEDISTGRPLTSSIDREPGRRSSGRVTRALLPAMDVPDDEKSSCWRWLVETHRLVHLGCDR